jgi:hypothetical protein
MPKKKAKTIEQQEAEVLDSYESWLKRRPVKKAHAQAGETAEDKE